MRMYENHVHVFYVKSVHDYASEGVGTSYYEAPTVGSVQRDGVLVAVGQHPFPLWLDNILQKCVDSPFAKLLHSPERPV